MKPYILLSLVLILGATAGLPSQAAALSKDAVAALCDKMPDADKDGRYTGPDPADAAKVYDELIAGGKESVAALVALIAERGPGDDWRPRYVLHGLVTYVARPDADKDRPMVCEALLSTLGGPAAKAVQGLVLQEIQCIARKDAAPAVAKFVLDEDLYDPAIRVLESLGDTADLIRPALASAKGRNRLAVIQALGRMRDTKAVADLLKESSSDLPDARVAAREALGNIGQAQAADTLLAAADAAKDFERFRSTEAVLVLAKRLAAADNKKDAERIYRKLWESRTAAEERQIRIAALTGLAEVRGDIKDIFAAMQVDEPQVRAAAIALARALPGQDVTMTCVEAMKKAAGVERANLLALLGGRSDAAALAAVLAMFDDTDELVRIAAMRAAAAIGTKDAAEALVIRVTTRTGNDRAAAADALSRMRGPESAVAMSAGLAATPAPDIKVAFLGAFAARRLNDNSRAVTAAVGDADPAVRLAAIKAVGAIGDGGEFPPVVACLKTTKDAAEIEAAEKALVASCLRHKENPVADQVAAALADASPANTVAMIRVLGAAGTAKALAAVVANTTSANAEVKDAAVHALAEWKAKEGAAPLLEVARTSDNAAHKVLAVRGAVRLTAKDMSPEERMKILPEALKLATRPEEKREAIAALARLQSVESLQAVAPCLDDPAVQEEAAMAVVQIAEPLAKKDPDAVRDPVAKALKVTKNDRVRSTAERILGQDKK